MEVQVKQNKLTWFSTAAASSVFFEASDAAARIKSPHFYCSFLKDLKGGLHESILRMRFDEIDSVFRKRMVCTADENRNARRPASGNNYLGVVFSLRFFAYLATIQPRFYHVK